ncbi:hypothetical protein BC938DRAFT_479294 [Jimgerdemannia flammicorona]|uniref:Uncharacterized protein n=1 Tax=Jimgerdemannia flammicorona TaxID=994334 RepID=A0A433QL68_9FUNG|nr:hypothetical protein BC938DRAFT_479294 [Jimgerdemannia flammicorona]
MFRKVSKMLSASYWVCDNSMLSFANDERGKFIDLPSHLPVALCWGSTNPFIKIGSRGLDQISARYPDGGLKRSLAEIVYLFTRWQFLVTDLLIGFVLVRFTVGIEPERLSRLLLYAWEGWYVHLSLAVPITNSLTLIFTMLAGVLVGEKINGGAETWVGMAMVVAGVGLCVNSKV